MIYTYQKTVLLIIQALTFLITGYAQNSLVNFTTYTDINGLSNNSITCIFQDFRGTLWLGTQNGLNRFDGYSFRQYHSREKTEALSNDVITSIQADYEGRLIIGTSSGLNIYDPVNRKFIKEYSKYPILEQFKNCSISALSGKGDLIWIASKEKGLTRYAQKERSLSNLASEPLKNKTIHCLYEDKGQKLYIGTDKGLLEFTLGPKGELKYQATCFPNDIINVIYKDSHKNLWIGTRQGLIKIKTTEPTQLIQNEAYTRFTYHPYSPYSISHNDVRSVTEDKTQNIWIGTRGGGLNMLSLNTGTDDILIKYFQHTPHNPNSLVQNEVFTTLVDHSGTLWAGTYNGLSKIVTSFENFHHFQNNPVNRQSISNNNVAAILPWVINGDPLILIGGSGGINIAKEKTIHQQNDHFFTLADTTRDIEKRKVQSLFAFDSRTIWIGTKKGIRVYDYINRRFLELPPMLKKLPEVTIRKIHRDGTGLIWIGTIHGLFTWNEKDQTLSSSLLSSKKKRTADYKDYIEPNQYENVFDITEDLQGNIWVGTWGGGLVKFKAGNITNQPVRYNHNPSDIKSLSSNYVASLYCSRDGKLWIGTTNGLNLLRQVKNSKQHSSEFISYTPLPNSNSSQGFHVAGILEDHKGNLWLSTINSICKFIPHNASFLNYQFPFGNITKENYTMGLAKDSDGYLYFGGMSGFFSFHPDSIPTTSKHFPILLSEFQVSARNTQQKIPAKIDWSKRSAVLTYKDIGFSFSFSSTDYSISQQVSYAYKLEGFDQDWVYRNADQRYASYANLKPGNYVLKAKATNALGVWSQPETLFTIFVETPLWKRWWAYAIYFVVLISGLYQLIRYMLERERLKNRLEMEQMEKEKIKELEELKLGYFTNISHEFRTPLTLILGPLEQLSSKISPLADHITKENLSFIRNNIDHLFRLINQLMDFRKVESNKLTLSVSEGEVIRFIEMIKDSFAALAEGKHIRLFFTTDKPVLYAWCDWDKLEKILNNLLYNAITYTPSQGAIRLKLTHANNSELTISIEDTGYGIPKNQVDHIFEPFYQANTSTNQKQYGYGIGLSLVEKLVKLHHGSIAVMSEVNKGSTFRVTIPINKGSYSSSEIHLQHNTGPIEHNTFIIPVYPVEKELQNTAPHNSYKLLIVDDNPEIRRYLFNCFSNIYQIVEAADGFEGLEKALSNNPDIIITDVLMPEMDGNEFCEKIKSNIATCHIPIIMLTAVDQKEQQIKGLETGADIYMVKPFHHDVLIAQVKRLLESRETLRKYFQKEINVEPGEVTVTSIDSLFLSDAMELIEKNINNANYTIDQFAKDMAMGRSALYRKIKNITGLSPNDFIKTLRLKKAAHLLSTNKGNISEICYEVGFTDPGYFTKCFKKQFGQTPKDYIAKDGDL